MTEIQEREFLELKIKHERELREMQIKHDRELQTERNRALELKANISSKNVTIISNIITAIIASVITYYITH